MNDKKEPGFSEIMGSVKRLKNDRVNHYQQRDKKPVGPIRRPLADDPGPDYTAPDPSRVASTHFHSGLQTKLQRKIRQGLIRPEASLDLHGYRERQALETLAAFIESALRHGQRMVVVIHGQGFRSQTAAVLKPAVHRLLGNHPAVLAWCPAQPRDGAGGASYVYLRSA